MHRATYNIWGRDDVHHNDDGIHGGRRQVCVQRGTQKTLHPFESDPVNLPLANEVSNAKRHWSY